MCNKMNIFQAQNSSFFFFFFFTSTFFKVKAVRWKLKLEEQLRILIHSYLTGGIMVAVLTTAITALKCQEIRGQNNR